MTTHPPFAPHRVQLTGYRDLGIVPARWLDGGRLEVQHPEHSGVYGPSALYRVQRAEPAEAAPTPSKPEPLRWRKDEDGYWRLHDGDRPTLYWSTPLRAYVSQAVSVPAYSLAESVAIVASAAMEKGHKVEKWSGEPKPKPKPSGVVLRGWERQHESVCWFLRNTAGRARAYVNARGWAADDTSGPETGLHGKKEAVERLLADGARWESQQAQWQANDQHTPNAIDCFYTGDIAVMVDGTRRTVAGITQTATLFTDGTWLDDAAAPDAIAARIPAADRT